MSKLEIPRIDVMEYATRRRDGAYALGALDLIENPESTLPMNLINPQRVQGGASPSGCSTIGIQAW